MSVLNRKCDTESADHWHSLSANYFTGIFVVSTLIGELVLISLSSVHLR